MFGVHVDTKLADEARRERIFAGHIFLSSPRPSVLALCAHADAMIKAAFAGVGDDVQRAQFFLPVEQFVAIIAPLKSAFTNDLRTKRLVQEVIEDFGGDLDRSYFDVPRLRVVTDAGYLSAGVGYAYKAHRDTWYSSPPQQVNWWAPVYDLTAEHAMSLYPAYFDRPLPNSSGDFDYDEWVRVGRRDAVHQIKVDSRKHPLPKELPDSSSELRFVAAAGSLMQFSACQLHATAPNTSGLTRFSFDFRTVHTDDLTSGRSAPNVDNASRGTPLGDFLRASDLSPFSGELLALAR